MFLAPVFLVALLKAAFGRPATSVTEKVAVPRFSLLLVPMVAMAALTAISLGYTAAAADRRMTLAMGVAAATTILMSGILTAMTPDDRKRRSWRVAAATGTALVCLAFVVRAF